MEPALRGRSAAAQRCDGEHERPAAMEPAMEAGTGSTVAIIPRMSSPQWSPPVVAGTHVLRSAAVGGMADTAMEPPFRRREARRRRRGRARCITGPNGARPLRAEPTHLPCTCHCQALGASMEPTFRTAGAPQCSRTARSRRNGARRRTSGSLSMPRSGSRHSRYRNGAHH